MPPLQNLSFELNDFGGPGDADGWNASFTGTAVDSPLFSVTEAPFEGFERGWSNNTFLFAFSLLTDVAPPSFTTLSVVSKFVEDFEELWSSNQDYFWEIGTPSLGPEGIESFDTGWGNDSAQLSPFAVLGDGVTTVAAIAPAETFNTGWDNDSYSLLPHDLVTLAGLGTAPLYEGGSSVEAFQYVFPLTPFTVYDVGSGLLHSDPCPAGGDRVAFVLGTAGNLPPPLIPDLDYPVESSEVELGLWRIFYAMDGPMVGLHFWRRTRSLYWDEVALTF